MNLLLVTLVFPYPINDGGKSGTFRMIDVLRENHKVTLICPESREKHLSELRTLWPDVNIIPFKKTPGGKKDHPVIDFFKTLLGRKLKLEKHQVLASEMQLSTSNLENFYFGNLLEIFIKEAQSGKYNLIQVDFIDLAPLVHFIPKGVPSVFVHHELRYKRMMRERDTLQETNEVDEWKIQNTKVLEIGLINRYDKVVCLTEIDRRVLLEDGVYPYKLEVSPLPMILNEHAINQPFKFRNRLVFLGPDQHYPNLDGIDWFLKNCWEQLRSLNPGLTLSVVGKWSEEKQKWFEHYEGVKFEGFVPNLEDVMEGSIMIVPLRIGSGMRMKILEGVSYHVPIVSTSIGAEGLPMKNGMNSNIADTAADFILATDQLVKSPELQNTYIENAKLILSKGYSAKDCTHRREDIYERMLGVKA